MKKWLMGLLNAAINGGATAGIGALGSVVTGTPIALKTLGITAAGGAIVGTLRHLQQSPLPGIEGDASNPDEGSSPRTMAARG